MIGFKTTKKKEQVYLCHTRKQSATCYTFKESQFPEEQQDLSCHRICTSFDFQCHTAAVVA